MKIMPGQPAFQSTQGELSEASSDKAVVAALKKFRRCKLRAQVLIKEKLVQA
jgi:hypothetical protein